jgi:hypothetical protein
VGSAYDRELTRTVFSDTAESLRTVQRHTKPKPQPAMLFSDQHTGERPNVR